MAAGSVIAIHLTPARGAPMARVAEARAVPGQGLEGDRFFRPAPPPGRPPSCDVTLIESEAVEAAARDWDMELSPAETRRNIVTRGVALNTLIGRTFRLGAATLLGVKPCAPCAHLAALTGKPVLEALEGRGGLRARIIEGGSIRVGDAVDAVD